MWHYKLPTKQQARRTYTRCLLEECCSDNVYNYYYYYYCRQHLLRVSGEANFVRFMGTTFGVRTDDFFATLLQRCYIYICTYNQVTRDARKLISKKVILIPGPWQGGMNVNVVFLISYSRGGNIAKIFNFGSV